MKIFRPDNARGFAAIHHMCFLLEWSDECEKLSKVELGKKTADVDSIDVKLHLKERGKGKLPDFYYTNSHPIVSDRFIEVLGISYLSNIEAIPTRLVGARIEPRSGAIEEIELIDSGIVIDRKYYVLNVTEPSNLLDVDRTTMSKEFILPARCTSELNPPPNIESEPGIYINAVFKSLQAPPVFVLPGKPFGLLVSEGFRSLVKKHRIRGMCFVELMDTESDNLLNMHPTGSENIVSMREAWQLSETIRA